MATRLARFRTFMAALDPSGDPVEAVTSGLYVTRSGGSVADELAGRLELQPASSHLLLGGIGSGKTTELWATRLRLSQTEDTHVEYIDVSRVQQLDELRAETLIVIAGLALGSFVGDNADPAVKAAITQFRGWAYGGIVPDQDDDAPDSLESFGDERWLYIPGILRPPRGGEMVGKTFALRQIADAIRDRFPHIVLLFDSLDRISDPTLFTSVVASDLRAITSCGIGAVVVGPLPLLYGIHRSTADHFDYEHLQTWADWDNANGRQFLVEVLRKRAPGDLLSDHLCAAIAKWSGGALRDLISIAQTAVQEAYVAGASAVEPKHVERAADRHGRALIRGLVQDELDTLQLLRTKGVFVPVSDREYALLATRRVFEYRAGGVRYAVHPTLIPLLEQLDNVMDLDL